MRLVRGPFDANGRVVVSIQWGKDGWRFGVVLLDGWRSWFIGKYRILS
jgi:hypothetical protein